MIRSFGSGRSLLYQSCKQGNRRHIRNNVQSGNQLRHSSSKKPPSGSAKLPKQFSEPPKIEIDLRKSSILHEKAARAAELHAELNVLLDKQAKRRAEELNRPFGAGFIQFMKNSKSEMINIFAAFMCVVLAYQIAVIRRGARNLVEQAEEREKVVEDLKRVLRTMSSSDYGDSLAEKCAQALDRNNNDSLNVTKINQSRISSLFSSRSNIDESRESSTQNRSSIIGSVLKAELHKIIGDIALSDSEMAEKKMKELQEEMGLREKMISTPNGSDQSQCNDNESAQKAEISLFGADEVISEIQSGIHSDLEQVVVKRKKGFI